MTEYGWTARVVQRDRNISGGPPNSALRAITPRVPGSGQVITAPFTVEASMSH
jgi:hypothetical protein